jgi:hypothetical protein
MAVSRDDSLRLKNWRDIPDFLTAPILGTNSCFQDCKLQSNRKVRPRCPQVAVDVGHLLRIPPDHTFPDEPEDEFRCTNLDVVLPDRGPDVINSNLPVLVWIHGKSYIEPLSSEAKRRTGGSQAVTFGSAASGVCGMEPAQVISCTDVFHQT